MIGINGIRLSHHKHGKRLRKQLVAILNQSFQGRERNQFDTESRPRLGAADTAKGPNRTSLLDELLRSRPRGLSTLTVFLLELPGFRNRIDDSIGEQWMTNSRPLIDAQPRVLGLSSALILCSHSGRHPPLEAQSNNKLRGRGKATRSSARISEVHRVEYAVSSGGPTNDQSASRPAMQQPFVGHL